MELSSIQHLAINHITDLFSHNINSICALDTGLGKTRVACEIIKAMRKNTKNCEILIVHRASSFHDPWDNELKKWNVLDGEEESVWLYGKGRERHLSGNGKYIFGNKIIQTSYDTITIDIENNRFDFNERFDLIVFDEIHTIINNARLTKKCKIISKIPALNKVALTGTPIQNHVNDLGLIYLFLNDPKSLSGPAVKKIPVNELENAVINCLDNDALFFRFMKKRGIFKNMK
jgi:superfamily II DNA or RNA helicase